MNVLTKAGVIGAATHEGQEDELIAGAELMKVLREDIEIDEKEPVTLRDLFRIFEPIKGFISQYSLINYDAYVEELNKPVDWSKKESCPMDHIVVKWMGEYFEEYNNFRTSVDACGVDSSVPIEDHGKWDKSTGQSKSRYWAIDAQPMNSIADMPIKLDTKFGITKLESGKHIVKNWNRAFSLLEVIDAVFYEVSYFGLPEDRDAFMDMLGERLDEVKNMTEEEKKVKLIPWEEVKKRMEKMTDEDRDAFMDMLGERLDEVKNMTEEDKDDAV